LLLESGRRVTARHIRQLEKAGVTELEVPREYLHGRVTAQDIVDENTGEVIVECNTELTEEYLEKLEEAGIETVETIYTNDLSTVVPLSPTH